MEKVWEKCDAKDLIVIFGAPCLIYIVAKAFNLSDFFDFYYTIFLFIISVLMSTLQVIMYSRFELEGNGPYYILVVIYGYEGINMLLGIMMEAINYRDYLQNSMIFFECHLLEIICFPLYIKYAGVKIDQDKMPYQIGICFIVALLCSKILYYTCSLKVYIMVESIVVFLLIIGTLSGFYFTRKFRWHLAPQGYVCLNVFLSLKTIYYMTVMYIVFIIKLPVDDYIHCVLIYVKFLSIYYVYKSLYYNCVKKQWVSLVEKLRVTEEKISSNSHDRSIIINLSHELKTPLNVIQSGLQILRMDTNGDKVILEALKDIRCSCNESLKIIINMIDLNKLRGGHLKANRITCNMVEVIENMVEAFASEYTEANLVFNTNEEEFNTKIDYEMLQRLGLYMLGTMLNLGRTEIYVELDIHKEMHVVSIKMEAEGICRFIKAHHKDIKNYKTEEIGDLLALQFMRYILRSYNGEITYGNDNWVSVTFENLRESQEEPVYLEDNVSYLQEQICSSYHNAIDKL